MSVVPCSYHVAWKVRKEDSLFVDKDQLLSKLEI